LHEPQDRFLVVDPDRELARILAAEISEGIGRIVPFAGYDQVHDVLDEASCVLMTGRFAKTDPEGLRTRSSRTIQLKPMEDLLAEYRRPPGPILLGVVSRSNAILRWATTLVAALGFSPDAVVFRNLEQPGWRNGLRACHILAADVVTAEEIGWRENVLVFRVVSSQFLAELHGLAPRERETKTHNGGGQDRS
jgi:hypothetical protein